MAVEPDWSTARSTQLTAGNFVERYWDPVVHVRNGIAVVWTPYEFLENGTSSHCGIDVFELAKENGRWRIGNMMWTVEPDACPAMRPADPSRPPRTLTALDRRLS